MFQNMYQSVSELSENEDHFRKLCFRIERFPFLEEAEFSADHGGQLIHRIVVVARQVSEACHNFGILPKPFGKDEL
jgi:hypothetical protein